MCIKCIPVAEEIELHGTLFDILHLRHVCLSLRKNKPRLAKLAKFPRKYNFKFVSSKSQDVRFSPFRTAKLLSELSVTLKNNFFDAKLRNERNSNEAIISG